jgi:hypothetical protein
VRRLLPLDYFVRVARNPDADPDRRARMARAAERRGAPLWPSSRDRVRRWRARQAAGCLSVTVDIGQQETAVLYRLGYLREEELEQRDAIVRALHGLLGNIVAGDDM